MSGGQIEGVEIPLPPLPVQRRIAGILSAYDELIENCQRRINILEEIPELPARFEGFVRPFSSAVLRNSRKIDNLRRTRDLLLPRLLSGQVSLS